MIKELIGDEKNNKISKIKIDRNVCYDRSYRRYKLICKSCCDDDCDSCDEDDYCCDFCDDERDYNDSNHSDK